MCIIIIAKKFEIKIIYSLNGCDPLFLGGLKGNKCRFTSR